MLVLRLELRDRCPPKSAAPLHADSAGFHCAEACPFVHYDPLIGIAIGCIEVLLIELLFHFCDWLTLAT